MCSEAAGSTRVEGDFNSFGISLHRKISRRRGGDQSHSGCGVGDFLLELSGCRCRGQSRFCSSSGDCRSNCGCRESCLLGCDGRCRVHVGCEAKRCEGCFGIAS